jgi:hypothetical protein
METGNHASDQETQLFVSLSTRIPVYFFTPSALASPSSFLTIAFLLSSFPHPRPHLCPETLTAATFFLHRRSCFLRSIRQRFPLFSLSCSGFPRPIFLRAMIFAANHPARVDRGPVHASHGRCRRGFQRPAWPTRPYPLHSLASDFFYIFGNLKAILIAHVFYNTTIIIRVVGNALSSLDPKLEAAARSLGADRSASGGMSSCRSFCHRSFLRPCWSFSLISRALASSCSWAAHSLQPSKWKSTCASSSSPTSHSPHCSPSFNWFAP